MARTLKKRFNGKKKGISIKRSRVSKRKGGSFKPNKYDLEQLIERQIAEPPPPPSLAQNEEEEISEEEKVDNEPLENQIDVKNELELLKGEIKTLNDQLKHPGLFQSYDHSDEEKVDNKPLEIQIDVKNELELLKGEIEMLKSQIALMKEETVIPQIGEPQPNYILIGYDGELLQYGMDGVYRNPVFVKKNCPHGRQLFGLFGAKVGSDSHVIGGAIILPNLYSIPSARNSQINIDTFLTRKITLVDENDNILLGNNTSMSRDKKREFIKEINEKYPGFLWEGDQ